MNQAFANVAAFSFLTFGQITPVQPSVQVLSQHQISLDQRYQDKWVNGVFKDNILLNLAYFRGLVNNKAEISWEQISKPFVFEFRLDPNQAFSYHDQILDKYQGKVNIAGRVHFNGAEGFKSDGYLYGDGVCHLASLIYWVAKDANLSAEAPTNHNFANIPQIPKEMGVSILSNPASKYSGSRQNLYITNNRSKTIAFKFEYKDSNLKVSAIELD